MVRRWFVICLPVLALSCCLAVGSVAAKEGKRKILLNGFVQETLQNPKLESMPVQRTYRKPLPEPGPGIVGLDLAIRPGDFPMIRQVFRGSPAFSAGLRTGDVLLSVDGGTTLDKTLQEVDLQISDVPGTPIAFRYLRDGRVYDCRLVVASLNSVPGQMRSIYSMVPGIQGPD